MIGSSERFWMCWEKVVGDYLHSMRLDDMDYPTMLKVYNLVRQRQPIDHVIRHYNETYFRELVWTLKRRAYKLSYEHDG